jgi:hypothetical protein
MTTTLVTSGRGIGGFAYPCFNAQGSMLLKGQPVMRRQRLDYAGGVMHPVGAAGLAEFAGILTSPLNTGGLGDIASSRMIYEGEVKATVRVHATPSNYIAGAQLAPFYDSTNGAYLMEVAYQTGITLLENWTGKTANTLYSENTGLGAWVEIDGQVNHRTGPLHYAFATPTVPDVDYFATATATSASAITEVTTFLTTGGIPDYARNVTVTPGGTTADVNEGNIVVDGVDIWGNVIQDLIAIAENASTIVTGVKAFARITKVTFPIQDGAGATYTIGTGPALGLGRCFVKPCVLQSKAGTTIEGTAPTLAVDADEVSKNTITYNSALNSTLRESWILAA